jgi:hypothetical protein
VDERFGVVVVVDRRKRQADAGEEPAAKKLAGDQAEITGKKFSRGGVAAIMVGKS